MSLPMCRARTWTPSRTLRRRSAPVKCISTTRRAIHSLRWRLQQSGNGREYRLEGMLEYLEVKIHPRLFLGRHLAKRRGCAGGAASWLPSVGACAHSGNHLRIVPARVVSLRATGEQPAVAACSDGDPAHAVPDPCRITARTLTLNSLITLLGGHRTFGRFPVCMILENFAPDRSRIGAVRSAYSLNEVVVLNGEMVGVVAEAAARR